MFPPVVKEKFVITGHRKPSPPMTWECIMPYCAVNPSIASGCLLQRVSNYKALIFRWYPAKRALPAMLTHAELPTVPEFPGHDTGRVEKLRNTDDTSNITEITSFVEMYSWMQISHTHLIFYPYQPSNSCLICKTSFKHGQHVGSFLQENERQLKPNSATNRCNSSHAPAVALAETRCNFAKGGSIFSKCKIRIWPMKLSWKNVPEILWMSLKNFCNVPEGLAEGLAALRMADRALLAEYPRFCLSLSWTSAVQSRKFIFGITSPHPDAFYKPCIKITSPGLTET